MTDGFTYVTAIKDDISAPGAAAKKALVGLKEQLKLTEASIKSLKDAQMRFKRAGLKEEVKASSDAIAKMREESSGLKEKIKETTTAIKEASTATDDEGESSTKAGMAAGLMVAALDLGKDVFRKIGEAAMWAADKLAHWTLEGAKVAIEAGAMKERLVSMYDYFGAGKGQEIFAKLDALGTAIHVPTEKVHEYAKDLIQSGIEGQNRIEQTVKSVAMLQKVAGDDAANKVKGLIEESAKTQKTQFWKGGRGTFAITREQLVGTGVTIDEVYAAIAKRTKMSVQQVKTQMMMGQITAAQGIDALNDVLERGKVGDTARNMTGDLTQAFTELKDSIGKILRDVDYKGFVKEVSGLARIFDPMQASGKTTKSVMVNVFNTIFDVGKKVIHAVKLGILDLEIAGLRLLIFLAPQIKQFKKLFTELKNNAGMAVLAKFAWMQLKGAFVAVAFALKGTLIFINGAMMALDLLGKAIEKTLTVGKDLAKALDLKEVGGDMIKGLIQGVKDGAGAVKEAIVGVTKGAVGAAKEALGIHSPSREMMKLGEYTASGFEKGVEKGGGVPGLTKQTPQLAPSGGGGVTLNLGGMTFEIHGGGKVDPETIDMFRSKLTDALEQIAEQLGGRVGSAK